MPVISMLHGILICMSTLDTQHHNMPHLHARFAEFEASIGIDDGAVPTGDLRRKQKRLVQARVDLHRDELMADWPVQARNISGMTPFEVRHAARR